MHKQVLFFLLLGGLSASPLLSFAEPAVIKTNLDYKEKTNTAAIITNLPNYGKSLPFLGVLVPGLPQYQAGDPEWGTCYLVYAVIGAGIFAWSQIAYSSSETSYNSATATPDAARYFNLESSAVTYSYIGFGIWAVSAAASVLQACFGPSYPLACLPGPPIQLAMDPKGSVLFACSWRF